MKQEIDFYDKTNLSSYNLNESMRYQLSMIDTLDMFTRLHCEHVANLTCRLCEYMHLNKSFTIYCTVCAYLHDIGKLFIPPSILQKNGPLTDEEYEIMKTHTTIGYNMCMEDPKLRNYSAGAKYHHEALNGTGYPEKLTKKDIPLEGQIIRVADEFDAIVNKRQYKSHIGISNTLKILLDEVHPNSSKSDNVHHKSSSVGKINPKVLKCLFKVVIDDTEYEISCMYDYVKHLHDQIKRLESIDEYHSKMESAKTDDKREYFRLCIKLLFKKGEDFDNYKKVLEDYKTLYSEKKNVIDNLYKEIKIIKKLKI